MNKNTKEVVTNMEFLLKELHSEWDRTGVVKASVHLTLEEVEQFNYGILERMARQQYEVECGKITFKKSVRLSHENYIMLRLVRKIKEQEERIRRGTVGGPFKVELDREEFRFFKEILDDGKK